MAVPDEVMLPNVVIPPVSKVARSVKGVSEYTINTHEDALVAELEGVVLESAILEGVVLEGAVLLLGFVWVCFSSLCCSWVFFSSSGSSSSGLPSGSFGFGLFGSVPGVESSTSNSD